MKTSFTSEASGACEARAPGSGVWRLPDTPKAALPVPSAGAWPSWAPPLVQGSAALLLMVLLMLGLGLTLVELAERLSALGHSAAQSPASAGE